MQTMIVFCHLRWDFVFQRPQHLLTRLARHYRILVVEEPVYHAGPAFLRQSAVCAGLTVCQPHTASRAAGFHDDQLALLAPLLAGLEVGSEDPVVWFYTPMALPLLQGLHPALVVYDCMDELAAFKNAPKQLLQRETALLGIADIVFTGGPSLYQAKRGRHPNVHCFPSSVDAAHFGKARTRGGARAPGASPRLGFFGVIDERFDTALLAALAAAHPEWDLIMVGPVLKIDPQALPQAANIHYLGQQSYAALPDLLASWDVCLLPFALNESTRFISPTKVLEYMAAELPIVSTPITDVKVPYGHLVAVAATPAEFIGACEAALSLDQGARAQMAAAMRATVAATSWEATAAAMQALLAETGRGAPRVRGHAGAAASAAAGQGGAAVNRLRSEQTLQPVKAIIVGAGPTGLAAAYHLGADSLLLERHASVGGWCRSISEGGFTFDHAGHIMFSNDPYVLKLYDLLLGSNQHWQNREAWVYSKQVYTRYPFQGALYGLPPAVIKECVIGAMEARYGAVARPACLPAQVEDCCADGTLDAASASSAQPGDVANFEQFIYKVWGAGIARHFAIPYNRKLWTVPLTQMETSWLGGRVPLPDLEDIIEGALEPVAKPMGPNARFGYPLKGGFQALMTGFLPHLRGKLELNADVVHLSPREHLIALGDGRRFRYDSLISTVPLPELVRMAGDAAPPEVQAAARGLRHVSIRCVNIGVRREHVSDKHWIYYPEDSIFHRIFVQGNASPACNAPGGFGFTCEISYSPSKPLPLEGGALIQRCIEDCIKVGFIRADDQIMVANQVDMPCAYVVYDHARARNVATVKAWMAQHDIILAGRYSEWEYYNSDHAFIAGRKAAEQVRLMAPRAALVQPT